MRDRNSFRDSIRPPIGLLPTHEYMPESESNSHRPIIEQTAINDHILITEAGWYNLPNWFAAILSFHHHLNVIWPLRTWICGLIWPDRVEVGIGWNRVRLIWDQSIWQWLVFWERRFVIASRVLSWGKENRSSLRWYPRLRGRSSIHLLIRHKCVNLQCVDSWPG